MKRAIIVLLGVVFLIPATTSFSGECGDVNGLPGVDILDIVHLINFKYKGGPPPDCGTVTDIDGNVYQTVTIGTQVWMAENLKVMHYRNGDPIPNVTDQTEWNGLSTGAYCNYGNDEHNVATYGRLYNWFAVDDSRNITPEGWHVATNAEWTTLIDYLGGVSVAAGKLKEAGTEHWKTPNTGGTNESGFTALPGSNRGSSFVILGYEAWFWTADGHPAFENNAYAKRLIYSQESVGLWASLKYNGFSVRCVKD